MDTQAEEADVERGLGAEDVEMSTPVPSAAAQGSKPAPPARSTVKANAKAKPSADATPKRNVESAAPSPGAALTIDLENIVAAGTKRAAAAKATKRLHEEIAPDILKFQKESKRKDPVSPKDRKKARLPSVHRSSSVMRQSDDDGSENGDGSDDSEARRPKPVKRARRRSSTLTTDIGLNTRLVTATDAVEVESEVEIKPSESTGIQYLMTGVSLSAAEIKVGEVKHEQVSLSDRRVCRLSRSLVRSRRAIPPRRP